jgi:3-phenylpropionate/trans-cinnamate dioxygenase alpha subunit/dibenzofuran dioxygenase alpha subunit
MMEQLVNTQRALVSRGIYSDPEIHRLEQERVFGRCWLFLGHESMLPRPGDYMTNTMGEDPVLLVRDQSGQVRAFLNTCRHRGNKVCLFDRGNARNFTCSYHGWSYNIEGRLIGVPQAEEAYFDTLDKDNWGLYPVPRVEAYQGLIFGCLDPNALSLEEYLGDLRWYLDVIFLADDLEFLPQTQKIRIQTNWKVPAENANGDHYHNVFTHASVRSLGLYNRTFQEVQTPTGRFEVAVGPHGLGGFELGEFVISEGDLAQARAIGSHVVDWLHARQARARERLKDRPVKPRGFSRGNIFPNCTFIGSPGFTAFNSYFMGLWHPRGPQLTEAWYWLAVERNAPPEVKEAGILRSMRMGNSASGMFGQDDSANFERVAESTSPPQARQHPFNFAMALKHDGHWPGSETWQVAGVPGEIGPHFAEQNQRRFYAYWAQLIDNPVGPAPTPAARTAANGAGGARQ